MTKKLTYDQYLHDELQDDIFAAAYLSDCIQDSPETFLLAVKHFIEARKVSLAELAKQIGVNRESLYKSLSGDRKPQYTTLLKIVFALGFSMQVNPPKPRRGRSVKPASGARKQAAG